MISWNTQFKLVWFFDAICCLILSLFLCSLSFGLVSALLLDYSCKHGLPLVLCNCLSAFYLNAEPFSALSCIEPVIDIFISRANATCSHYVRTVKAGIEEAFKWAFRQSQHVSLCLTSSRQEFNNSDVSLSGTRQFTCCNMSEASLQWEPLSTLSLECSTICSSNSYCSCSTSLWCPMLCNSYSERDLLTAAVPPILLLCH